jgi:hypothetical protein
MKKVCLLSLTSPNERPCEMKSVYGRVKCGIWAKWFRKGVISYLFPMDVLVKRKSDHKQAIWKALKGSFSFNEDKEAESFGGCLEWNL